MSWLKDCSKWWIDSKKCFIKWTPLENNTPLENSHHVVSMKMKKDNFIHISTFINTTAIEVINPSPLYCDYSCSNAQLFRVLLPLPIKTCWITPDWIGTHQWTTLDSNHVACNINVHSQLLPTACCVEVWGIHTSGHWALLIQPISDCLDWQPSLCCQKKLSLKLRNTICSVSTLLTSDTDHQLLAVWRLPYPGRRITFAVSWKRFQCLTMTYLCHSSRFRYTMLYFSGFQSPVIYYTMDFGTLFRITFSNFLFSKKFWTIVFYEKDWR